MLSCDRERKDAVEGLMCWLEAMKAAKTSVVS